jgi:NitT/TauT family transport system substrate-binding protein
MMRSICALVLLGACSSGGTPARDEPLVVGVSVLRISLPVFVAEEQGLFRRHGLPVELRRYETAQPLVEELLDGRLPAGGYAALPILFTAGSRDGSTARIAGALIEDETHEVSYLLRRRDDPTLRTVEDLRGRTVGVLPTVAYRRWLDRVLIAGALNPGEVTVVNVAPPQQVSALAEGGVDALFTNDPMATAALASGVAAPLGPEAPVPRALGRSVLFGSFLVHPDLVRERPDAVDRLLRALDDAIERIAADQAGMRRAMIPFVRPSESAFVDRYPPVRYLRSTELDDAMLAAEATSEHELGIVPAVPETAGLRIAAREAA